MINPEYKKVKFTYLNEDYPTLYDFLVEVDENERSAGLDFLYKNDRYISDREMEPGKNHWKPYMSFYKDDGPKEKFIYFESYEEMFFNYKLDDGTKLCDIFTDPKYLKDLGF